MEKNLMGFKAKLSVFKSKVITKENQSLKLLCT